MPHAVIPDLANEYLIVPDMSLDELAVYHFDAATGTVEASAVLDVPIEAKGPRHGEFLHGGRILLVVNELGSSISTVAFDAADGRLEVLYTAPIEVPVGVVNKPSGVVIDRDRSLAHIANRGCDDVTTFHVDVDGAIRLVSRAPGHGREPRGLALSPEGDLILLAHEHSHEITVHDVGDDGLISGLRTRAPVQGATAVAFGPTTQSSTTPDP